MNVKFSLKYKIFAGVFFIQFVIIAVFIHSFVTSFKEEKLTSAYEVNAFTISEIKTKLDNKVTSILDKIKSATILVEKNKLDKSGFIELLNLDQDKSIEALLQYDWLDEKSSLVQQMQVTKLNFPDMTAYFNSFLKNQNKQLPFFWNLKWHNHDFVVLGVNFNYDIEVNQVKIQKKKYFFIFFNKSELFQVKNKSQLVDIFIFNKNGESLYTSSDSSNEINEDLFQSSAFENALKSTNIVQVSQYLFNKKNYLMSTLTQPFGEIVIATLISADEAFSGVSKVYYDAFILAALSIIFNYIVTQYFSSTITKPLTYLMQQMQRVSKGELDIAVEVRSSDEVGLLAKNFKQMTKDLKTSKDDLQNLNRDLEQKVADRTKQLEELTIKDPLTGAYNRRYFDQKLLEEIQRSKRTNSPIGLLYLDIDHFKKYNDQNGHPEGDQLLINFVKTIKGVVRNHDFFCRLGGEEFCIVTVNTELNGLKIFAEKVRNQVYTTDFKFGEKQPMGRLSCSIGVSMFPDFADGPESLVKSADEALYHAKQGGRNRWVVAEKPTVSLVKDESTLSKEEKNKAS